MTPTLPEQALVPEHELSPMTFELSSHAFDSLHESRPIEPLPRLQAEVPTQEFISIVPEFPSHALEPLHAFGAIEPSLSLQALVPLQDPSPINP